MSIQPKPIIITPSNEHRFQCFVLFEPASSRISEVDVLIRGEEVRTAYESIMDNLTEDDSLKTQIIKNKLGKIGQMLSLLQSCDNVIISKFFDRVWRRYSYISNIGEPLLDLKTFKHFFPQYTDIPALLAQRLDDEDEDEDIDSTTDAVVDTEEKAVVEDQP